MAKDVSGKRRPGWVWSGISVVRLLVVCALVTVAGCATPFDRAAAPSRLLAGAPVAAPEGLLDYCLRSPAECGDAPQADLRGRISATGAASVRDISWSSSRDGASVFQAMMEARLAQPDFDPAAPASARMQLTENRWRQLRAVNRDINRSIRASTDRALYGVEEFWQRPLLASGIGARGDCEDYALEKRARLIAVGWPADALAIAVAVAPRIGLHATLLVQTDGGDFVLDNLHDEPRALASLNYVWLSRQTGASLTSWAAAQVAGAPTPQFVDASAEDMFQRLMRERISASPPEPEVVLAGAGAANAAPMPAHQPRRSKPEDDAGGKRRRDDTPTKDSPPANNVIVHRNAEVRLAQAVRRSDRPSVIPSTKA